MSLTDPVVHGIYVYCNLDISNHIMKPVLEVSLEITTALAHALVETLTLLSLS
jgi:hypothetical protein